MDKNIKAELSALKNEIIDKINNLEKRIFADSISTRYEPDPTFFSDNSPLGRHLIKEVREMSRLKNIVEDTFHQEEFKQVYNEMKDRVYAIHHSAMFPLDENYVDNRKPSLEYDILNTLKKIDEEIPITQEDVIKADVDHFTELMIKDDENFNHLKRSARIIPPKEDIKAENIEYLEKIYGVSEDGKKPFLSNELNDFRKYNKESLEDVIEPKKENMPAEYPGWPHPLPITSTEDNLSSDVNIDNIPGTLTAKNQELLSEKVVEVMNIDTDGPSQSKIADVICDMKNEVHQRRIPNKTNNVSIIDSAYTPLTIQDDYEICADPKDTKVIRDKMEKIYILPNDTYYTADQISEKITNDEIKEVVNEMNDTKNKLDNIAKYPDPRNPKYRNQQWLKDADKRPVEDIIKEALRWDEYFQEIFIKGWNETFEKRYNNLMLALEDLDICVKGYSIGDITVHNLDYAKQTMNTYQAIDNIKSMTLRVMHSKDKIVLHRLRTATPCGFVVYYKWLSELESDVTVALGEWSKLNKDQAHLATEFFKYFETTFEDLLKRHELDMYELTAMDPVTFKVIVAPDHHQSAFKKVSYNNYKKELTNAYKFLSDNWSGDTLITNGDIS